MMPQSPAIFKPANLKEHPVSLKPIKPSKQSRNQRKQEQRKAAEQAQTPRRLADLVHKRVA